jgi:glycosyltransferase involved in cell wall biosynthesis
MLRAYDRPGGIGIYSRNVVKHLLRIDQENQYVLLYNNKDHVGTYKHLKNVDEVFIPPANALVWDQWLVPKEIKRQEIDIVFNTKFSLPVSNSAKKVMVLHGSAWFVHPELFGKFDAIYARLAMPIYCRLADFLIANSQCTKNDFIEKIGVPEAKINVINLEAGDYFQRITNQEALQQVRNKYKLPERFILTVTSYDPRKNFSILLKAFEECYSATGVHLLVLGKNCEKYAEDHNITARGLAEVVHFLGWVEQEDLPAIYSLAHVFAFPSIYEEFGIPIVEAMSCGCPVVASNTGAIPALTDGAALLSDCFDYRTLARNIIKMLSCETLAKTCVDRGLERSKQFSWTKAARETLQIFEQINQHREKTV